jgi:hypothetical protein
LTGGRQPTDPNALQKIKEFIYKPKPDDLVIKPQGQTTKPKKQPRDAGD